MSFFSLSLDSQALSNGQIIMMSFALIVRLTETKPSLKLGTMECSIIKGKGITKGFGKNVRRLAH